MRPKFDFRSQLFMAIPNDATGYGHGSDARNVFAVYAASDDLSSLIKWECWDNDETFPTIDDLETTENDIFAGTTKNGSKSMIHFLDTSNAAPSSKIWRKLTASAGDANPNRMKGNTNYVEQDGSILTSGNRATFNMFIEIPSDLTTSAAMGFDVTARYTYTGNDPGLQFQFNEGTEGTPTWTAMTPGTHGIKHCRAGSSSPSDLYANIPTGTYVQAVDSDAALDDCTSGGSFTDTSVAIFDVEIDASGTPDTFRWRKNGGSWTTGVSITGNAQTLSDGVTVTFGATTGHTVGDAWQILAGAEDTKEGWATT